MPYDFVWHCRLHCQSFAPLGFANCWTLWQKCKSDDAWWWRHWCGWTKGTSSWSLYSWWHPHWWHQWWNMVQVTFTMNLYCHHLSHLTMSFLLSSKDIMPFLLSKSRQPMVPLMAIPTISANHLEAELDCTICTIWLWGEIDTPHKYLTRPITRSPSNLMWNYLFAFYILFCKGLEMIGHDKIHTASCTYIHVMFLCHLHTFTGYLKNTNENFQKIPFSSAFFSQIYT